MSKWPNATLGQILSSILHSKLRPILIILGTIVGNLRQISKKIIQKKRKVLLTCQIFICPLSSTCWVTPSNWRLHQNLCLRQTELTIWSPSIRSLVIFFKFVMISNPTRLLLLLCILLFKMHLIDLKMNLKVLVQRSLDRSTDLQRHTKELSRLGLSLNMITKNLTLRMEKDMIIHSLI